jgi:hypothetical protein
MNLSLYYIIIRIYDYVSENLKLVSSKNEQRRNVIEQL